MFGEPTGALVIGFVAWNAKLSGIAFIGATVQPLIEAMPALSTVAKTVAVSLTVGDRLTGSTAAASGVALAAGWVAAGIVSCPLAPIGMSSAVSSAARDVEQASFGLAVGAARRLAGAGGTQSCSMIVLPVSRPSALVPARARKRAGGELDVGVSHRLDAAPSGKIPGKNGKIVARRAATANG